MTVGVIIQARMTSTRLPGKVLIPLAGKTVLEHVVERCCRMKEAQSCALAITDNGADDPLEAMAKNLGIRCYRGSEENVALRYMEAARAEAVDVIVRITSDCPLIDPELSDQVIRAFVDRGADIASNSIQRTLPRGFDTEVFKASMLDRLLKEKNIDPFYLEHVTPYFYEHPERFRVESVTAPGQSYSRPDWRLCIDVEEDRLLLSRIFESMKGRGEFGASEVADLLNSHPDWARINSNVAHLKRGGKT